MATITRRTGSEGPKHDPYHYEELELTRTDDHVIIYHHGLNEWIAFDGRKCEVPDGFGHENYPDLFRFFAGITLQAAEKAYWRIHNTCRKCGSRDHHEEAGYPGEHFNVCDKCGEIISTDFYESEIM